MARTPAQLRSFRAVDAVTGEPFGLGLPVHGQAAVDAVCALAKVGIESERGRTVGQLQLFAELLRTGNWMRPHVNAALPERCAWIHLGPVAVFGARALSVQIAFG